MRPNWTMGVVRQSRLLRLVPDSSKLPWRATLKAQSLWLFGSLRGVDGLASDKLFRDKRRLKSLFHLLSELNEARLQLRRPRSRLSCTFLINLTSFTFEFRTPLWGCSLNNNPWCHTVDTDPASACVLWSLPTQLQHLPISPQICDDGVGRYTNRSLRIQLGIPTRWPKRTTQHSNPRVWVQTSLGEQGITYKISDACDGPFNHLMDKSDSIET